MCKSMDYKKAYKEALERARKLHGCPEYDAEIEEIFPELRESDDERIRKELLDAVDKARVLDIDKDVADRWTAWLEKQKEQKPLSTEETELNSIAFLEQMGYTCIPPGKEQKPAEWSEEDRMMLGGAFEFLMTNPRLMASRSVSKSSVLSWLKSLPERLNLPPKQEWSEEDADILNCCISSIEEAKENRYAYKETDGDTSYDREIAWLKSLRPQPQRRDTYYDIIHSILAMLKDVNFTKITPEHRVSLLNDIRVKCKHADECAAILDEPHWKPSEEQMKHLKGISVGWHPDLKDCQVLSSLYNDLQKLL